MCLLGGYTDEYLQESKQQLSHMARKLFPELELTEAEEVTDSQLISGTLPGNAPTIK